VPAQKHVCASRKAALAAQGGAIMKVQDLIDILSEQDPDAEVLLMNQRSWPFEYALAGVTCRAELSESDAEGDQCDDCDDCDTQRSRDFTDEGGTARTDVFLVEGTQLRYGNTNAWNVAVR
jgi:hypothetical protein